MMKKLLAVVLLATSLFSTAQEKVVVEYEFYNVFDLSKETNPKMLEIYKNSNEKRSYFELITTNEESIYKKIERIDNSQGKSGATISFGGAGDDFYKNLKDNESLTFMDYNGLKLIIKDSLKVQPWVIQKEKDKFLGYEVKKATYKEKNTTFTAWYAPKLAIKNGPIEFGGLPGLILKLEISVSSERGENKRIYHAREIRIDPKAKIEKPTKGKIVSEKEFSQIIEEENRKYDEMENNKVETKID